MRILSKRVLCDICGQAAEIGVRVIDVRFGELPFCRSSIHSFAEV